MPTQSTPHAGAFHVSHNEYSNSAATARKRIPGTMNTRVPFRCGMVILYSPQVGKTKMRKLLNTSDRPMIVSTIGRPCQTLWNAAMSGTTAIVGAPFDDDNGNASGSAYLFDTTTGQQIAKHLPDDGAASDNFGFWVAISGTIAIVGAYGDDDYGSGSAYVFDISDPGNSVQMFKLLPDDGAAGDFFGYPVAISGDTAIVGTYADDDR